MDTTKVEINVSSACRAALRQPPPVLRALIALGLTHATIAHALGVSRTLVTGWANARTELPDRHRLALQRLFTVAGGSATRTAGEVLADPDATDQMRAAAHIYLKRVAYARRLASGQEGSHGEG